MAERLSVLLEGGAFFESPRWHDGQWWVSDFYRHVVLAVSADGEAREVLGVEGQPSGLGWMPDGSLLVVSMQDHRVLRCSVDGQVWTHAEVGEFCGGPLNDMVVDGKGRAWVGNFGFELTDTAEPVTTCLVRIDPTGQAVKAADDLLFPNGMVITPEGNTLLVGESLACRYTAFTIAESGELTDRRVWGSFARNDAGTRGRAVHPDGCCLDGEGHVWAADGFHGRCVRLSAGGEIVDEVVAPDGLGVFACMLGGEDGRTLLLCAAPGHQPSDRASARDAVLLTTVVAVPHAGRP